MTSGSGTKPAAARSNRAREMPRACAAGQRLSKKACDSAVASGSARGVDIGQTTTAAAKTRAAMRRGQEYRLLRLTPALSRRHPTAAALAGIRALHRRPLLRNLGAHVGEQRLGRPAVELEAVGLLVGADQRARVHAGLAVDDGDLVAQPLQSLLDALDALGGELLDVGPGRHEGGTAGHAVAETAAEQRVDVGH